MTIASEITRIQNGVASAYTSVSTMGGTLPATQNLSNLPSAIESIPTGGSGEEWEPNPEWWDIETILKNDTRTYAGKAIILYSNADDFTNISISGPCVAVATSDGAFYTSTTTHTWDRTKDKIYSSEVGKNTPFGTRYLIIYYNSSNVAFESGLTNFYKTSIYAVFKCNLTSLFTSAISSYTFFRDNYSIQSFKFLNGYSLSLQSFSSFCANCYSLRKLPDEIDYTNSTDFTNFCAYSSLSKLPDNLDTSKSTSFNSFCYNCSSLLNLPDNLDTSKGTNFNRFCYGCYSLSKLPDDLDTSSGTNFDSFCYGCSSLSKLPDNLNTSSGTSFNSFCFSCYSLSKLPDNLDTSSGTNFGSFCYGCYSLKSIPSGLNVSNGTSFSSFCRYCYSLQELSNVLDISNGTNVGNLFLEECYSLIIANIKLPTTSSITTLNKSAFLSIESLRYIAQNAPNVSGKTLTIGATNITRAGGASGTIIQTLTNKGWTVN